MSLCPVAVSWVIAIVLCLMVAVVIIAIVAAVVVQSVHFNW